jgi:hypothetical protein
MNGRLWIALALPAVASYALLRSTGCRGAAPMDRALAAAMAPGLGLGAASCVYFGLLFLAPSHAAAARLDLVIWIAAVAAAAMMARRAGRHALETAVVPQDSSQPMRLAVLVAGTGLAAIATVAAIRFWLIWRIAPHGEWDAWAIWNLRARAMWRGMPEWTAAFTPDLAWSHPDYPLMLPLGVARLWAYAGQETLAAPALIAAVFLAASVATLVASVTAWRGLAAGLTSGIMLLAAPFYVRHAASQYADIPLAFFLLATVSLAAASREAGSGATMKMAAAGIAAALAAWTKNEGLMLVLLLPLVLVLQPGTARARRHSLAAFVAGAAPVMLIVAAFKIWLAPPSYLIAMQTPETMAAKLVDAGRYLEAAGQMASRTVRWGGGPVGLLAFVLAAALPAVSFDPRGLRTAAFGSFVVGGMLLGYLLAYVVTPLDIGWQIATSFDRLFAQCWPALVWTAFQLVGSPPRAAPGPGPHRLRRAQEISDRRPA